MTKLEAEQKRLLAFLLITVGVGLGLWIFWFFMLGQHTIGIDDANIFKVYARNVSEGFGFVYQRGRAPVEGFTSMLYLLLLTLLYEVLGNLDWAGLLLSFTLYLTSVVLMMVIIWHFVRQQTAVVQQWLMGLAAVWIAASPFYTIWVGLAQMDVSLWTCLVLLCLLWCSFIEKRSQWQFLTSGVLIQVALVLARPEGMVLAFMPLLALLIQRIIDQYRDPRHLKHKSWIGEIVLLFGWLGAVGGLTLFRLWYFGWPLPNTYYAKVSPDLWYRLVQGTEYLWSLISHQSFVIIPLYGLVKLSLMFRKQGFQKREQSFQSQLVFTLILVCVVALLTVLPVINGGDHFAGWRFYQPLWPIVGISVAFYLVKFHQSFLSRLRSGPIILPVLSGILMGLLIIQPYLIGSSLISLRSFRNEFVIAEMGRDLGEQFNSWLVDERQPPPVVGVVTIGGFALTYLGETYDLMGLTEQMIAHDGGQRKGFKNHASLNPELVLAKQPEILFPIPAYYGSVQPASISRGVLLYNDLFAAELFSLQPLADRYTPVWLYKKRTINQPFSATTKGVVAYLNNDFLETLQQDSLFEIMLLELD